jgi:hypothetical protein
MGNFFNNGPKILKLIIRVRIYSEKISKTTTFTDGHHWFPNSYKTQTYIKFVSDLRQVSGFLQVLQFPPPIKLTATI